MPPALGPNTTRVTFVAFLDDVEQLKRRYGPGWTERIRTLVHEDCKQYRQHKKTLEQLMKDQADG